MGYCCHLFNPPPEAEAAGPRLPPEDIGALFSIHAGGAPHLDEDGLRRYLGASQGEGRGDDGANVERLLEQIRGGRPRIPRQFIFTLHDFHRRVVFSHDVNPPIRHRRVHHDMTLPLSHYFIYSSYSLYYTRPLEQRSRSGRSDEPIIRALRMGVRAIEIAMWPNSKQDNIKIHHGWTRNTPVLLADCLKSIKKHAFVASPYPVIITLEDNLQSSNLQKKAAKVMLDVLGDILYWPATDHVDERGNAYSSNNPLKEFPSPEKLKGRVLLSTKPPSAIIKKEEAEQLQLGKEADDDDDEAAAWGSEVLDHQTEMRDGDDEDVKEQKMQPHEYPLYLHLITIGPANLKRQSTLQGEPDEVRPRLGLKMNKTIERDVIVDALQSESGKVRRLSWSKQQIEKAAKDHATDIVRFTQRNILRIYPSISTKGYPRPTRLTVSNYNPFLGWAYGAQMVALNMQEYGRALWLMHGFYRANGGCGYVRKPDFLIQTEPEVFDPRKPQPVKKTLKVKVYMGDGWLADFKNAHTSFIPDLWTSVGIAGVPADTTAMENTKATENTWVPVWEEEFSFDLTAPEIALLRVEVHQYDVSEKDVFGGQTVLPVSELRPGIRAVPLFDRRGNMFDNVRLLMRFELICLRNEWCAVPVYDA